MDIYEVKLQVKVGNTTKEDRYADNILIDAFKTSYVIKPIVLDYIKNNGYFLLYLKDDKYHYLIDLDSEYNSYINKIAKRLTPQIIQLNRDKLINNIFI